MYQLKLTPQARRQLDKLPTEDLGRIVTALERLMDEPRPSGTKKLRGSIYRIRTGDWRIIYAVFDKDNLIIVGKIARREKDTYDRIKDLF
ncbi:MAG: type II toxin-antitoxin system RelE/ParE family toxin [Chloroflexi bacterium]|nr:type II toxin-antitoxin system RelE/ParE family toxin [Chloroflexota bacterium]MBI3040539.1 type II toxin-antitoxin system RelE/ParE family toxin [Chloroflexota bacterium]